MSSESIDGVAMTLHNSHTQETLLYRRLGTNKGYKLAKSA